MSHNPRLRNLGTYLSCCASKVAQKLAILQCFDPQAVAPAKRAQVLRRLGSRSQRGVAAKRAFGPPLLRVEQPH